MKKVILSTFMYAPIGLVVGPMLFFWLPRGLGFAEAFQAALSSVLTNPSLFLFVLGFPFAWIYYFSSRTKQKTLPQTSSDTEAKVYTRDDNSANIMGFIEANQRGFSRISEFSGRATRAEYSWFTLTGGGAACILFGILAAVALNMAAESILGFDRYVELIATPSSGGTPDNPYFLTYLFSAVFIGGFPIYAVTIRRFHDIGASGGWWLLVIILVGYFQNPIVDLLVGLAMLYFLVFKRGDTYANRFGPNPLSFDEHSSSHESIASQIGFPADSETDAPADILDHLIEIEKLKQQTNTPSPQNLSKTEAKFYAQALTELESGKRDSAIWAKAYAEASDEESSKRLYVRLRADALRLAQKEIVPPKEAIIPPKEAIVPLSKAEEALLILNETKYDSASVKKSASKENKISSMSFSENVINQKHFAEAIKEIETDKRKDGLWAMAYATNESEEAAKKKYINLRAEELHQEELAQAEQEAKEKKLLREKQAKEDKLLNEKKAEEERKIVERLPELTSWALKNNFVIEGGKISRGVVKSWKIRKLPFGSFDEFDDDLSFVKHLITLYQRDNK